MSSAQDVLSTRATLACRRWRRLVTDSGEVFVECTDTIIIPKRAGSGVLIRPIIHPLFKLEHSNGSIWVKDDHILGGMRPSGMVFYEDDKTDENGNELSPWRRVLATGAIGWKGIYTFVWKGLRVPQKPSPVP